MLTRDYFFREYSHFISIVRERLWKSPKRERLENKYTKREQNNSQQNYCVKNKTINIKDVCVKQQKIKVSDRISFRSYTGSSSPGSSAGGFGVRVAHNSGDSSGGRLLLVNTNLLTFLLICSTSFLLVIHKLLFEINCQNWMIWKLSEGRLLLVKYSKYKNQIINLCWSSYSVSTKKCVSATIYGWNKSVCCFLVKFFHPL